MLLLALTASAAARQPVSREQEEHLRALEAEREGIVELAVDELLAIEPETFHGPLGRTDRPTSEVVNDLLLLDWALAVLEHGGAENLDRLRAAVQATRRRQVRDAALFREALADEVRPSPAERYEAGRTDLSLREVLSHPVEKPADDAPLPAGAAGAGAVRGRGVALPHDRGAPGAGASRPGAAPSAAPLDYIPVSAEELQALRERHRARGTRSGAWLDEVAVDPLAQQRWKEAEEAKRQTELRRSTPMAVRKEGGYAFGEWLLATFQNKEPIGLSVVAVGLLAVFGAVGLLMKLLRKDD